jgi:hypothetical protein
MIDLLVNIDVPEIESATAFYTQACGLAVGRSNDEIASRTGPQPIDPKRRFC